jgi:SSS family solute:Na+ symporter
MSSAAQTWLAMTVYALIGLTVALIARRRMGGGVNEFFLANRGLGGVVAALSYAATTYSAFMMVGLAGITYKLGVGALGFELTYLGGLVLVVFFGPRFWLAGKRFNYLTHAELLADRYQSPLVGVVATLLCLVFLIPYGAIQLMGIGYLLATLSDGTISITGAMAAACALAVLWAAIAGLRSVAWTDALQAVVMLISALLVLGFVIQRGFGGISPFVGRLNNEVPELLSGAGLFSFNLFIGLSLPWLFFSLSNPQVTQRLFVPRSVVAFKQMVGGFLIFGFIYTITAVLWGFSARLLLPDLAAPDLATPSLLALPIVPQGLVLVVMIGILAAAISTIDSIILTLSSLVGRDLVRNGLKVQFSEQRELRLGKWVVVVLAVIFFLFGRWAAGKSGLAFMIVPLSSAAAAGLLMAVPALIGAFFWKRATGAGALTSMTTGAVLVLVLQFSDLKPLGMWPGVWGCIVCVALFIGISLMTTPPRAKAEEFIGYLERELPHYRFF